MKKGIGIALVVLALGGVMAYMTVTDKGLGMQTAELAVSEVGAMEVLSFNGPVMIRENEGDTIVLSLQHDDKMDSTLDYTLEDGVLRVETEYTTTSFDFSLNPNKFERETLEISVPASADLTSLTIRTQDWDAVTVADVAADAIRIETEDGDVQLTGVEGEADARTAEGEITATATLSEEIEGDSDRGYSYQGRIGAADGGTIRIASGSGSIRFE